MKHPWIEFCFRLTLKRLKFLKFNFHDVSSYFDIENIIFDFVLMMMTFCFLYVPFSCLNQEASEEQEIRFYSRNHRIGNEDINYRNLNDFECASRSIVCFFGSQSSKLGN